MTEYKILTAFMPSDLERQVAEHLANGWTLQGGVSAAAASLTADRTVDNVFMQAMTRNT